MVQEGYRFHGLRNGGRGGANRMRAASSFTSWCIDLLDRDANVINSGAEVHGEVAELAEGARLLSE